MVQYHRYHQFKKGGDGGVLVEFVNSHYYCKKSRPTKLVSALLFSVLSCSLILIHVCTSSTFNLLHPFGEEVHGSGAERNHLCSSIPDGTICCDRSHLRTDICFMKGDVRTDSASFSLMLYSSRTANGSVDELSKVNEEEIQHEKIKPYTRKWEASVMNTIDELHLVSKREGSNTSHRCDVWHDVPAVFFSTGGYTGNVYHEFNDGLLPLYITSQHFNKKVVFVILEYHSWWIMKYGDILSHLTDYPPVDFSGDNRTHCFSEAIVGLRIHDELTVDSSLMEGNKTIVDFRNILDKAYWPRIKGLIQEEEREAQGLSASPFSGLALQSSKQKERSKFRKPKLVIVSRNGSRAITNEAYLVKMAEEIGFRVEVLRPSPTTELAKIYQAFNSSDVMIGVHGAAMTHCLFLRPGSVFIQVIPLGTDWAAEAYYGEPAKKLGLKYFGYKILPRESSLYEKYAKDDPVLINPSSVNDRGWQFTKNIYLDGQNVRLDLKRFRKPLSRAYNFCTLKRKKLVPL